MIFESLTLLNTILLITGQILNYLRHKHLEREMRSQPMTLCFEVTFTGESREPTVKVSRVDTGDQPVPSPHS